MNKNSKLYLFLACTYAALLAQHQTAHAQQRYFSIQVVDAASGAPVPCASVGTVHHVAYVSDRNGLIAFHEPSLMGVSTWLAVTAQGYEQAADDLGLRGARVTPSAGGSAVLPLQRVGTPAVCTAGTGHTERLAGFVPAAGDYYRIRVVDAATGRGLPLVEIRWPDGAGLTDNDGTLAFYEPAWMGRSVTFQARSHGYQPAGGTSFVATPQAGTTRELRLTPAPDQIAQRLYRATGADLYRDTLLTGGTAPIAQPWINGLVSGQDTVQVSPYRGKLFWIWGDTNWPSYPLGNFKATGATSQLPGAGGLDPERGVDYSYFVGDNGFARAMAPSSAIPNPPGHTDFLATWLGSLTNVRDAEGQERLVARYALIKSLGEAPQQGLALYDDGRAVFETALVFDGSQPARPEGHTLRWQHVGEDYVYFANDLRSAAQLTSVLDPHAWEAFTPLVAGSSGAIARDANGVAQYRFRSDAAPVTQALVDAGLALGPSERLFGHVRQPWTGQTFQKQGSATAWNPYRGRFIQVSSEIYGSSALGEQWYLEADTPMGPWVYARKIITHDNYTAYNPRLHPYFDRDGGKTIYFESTYTTFLTNAAPTPRYDYNQIMYKLALDDPRLALPVPIYDLGEAGRPGGFVTRRGLRRGMTDSRAAFFAFDRPAPGAVPVYWSDAGCRARTLRVGGTPTTPALFWALPTNYSPRPPDAIPLYRYRNATTQQEAYSVNGALVQPGFRRIGAIALVWPNPIAPALPVTQFLPSLIADAGADRCMAELAPGIGAPLVLDGSLSSHTGSAITNYTWRWRIGQTDAQASGVKPSVRLPPGLHSIELTVTGADGATSTDQVLVSVSAGQSPFVQSCSQHPQLGSTRVTWSAAPFQGGFAYAVQSLVGPSGASSAEGWTLHHRPSEGFPDNRYEPDTILRGAALIGYSVFNALIPSVPLGFTAPEPVSSLTCPGGVCVFSPARGCETTFTGATATARKVALVGDSLIWAAELCGFAPPAEGCAKPLATRLRDAGSRVWSKSAPGQGFVSWLDVIREQVSSAPALHILAFGTNDAAAQAHAAAGAPRDGKRWETLGSLYAALGALETESPGACAVLVTASEKSVAEEPLRTAYHDEAGVVNQLLTLASDDASFTNVQLADWAAATRAHCPADWLTRAGATCDWFGDDQLHLSRAGNEARDGVILEATARCGG